MPQINHDPWSYALGLKRDYLTPEDIQAAIDAGASFEDVAKATLAALGRKACEDASLCAFVAARFEKSPSEKE
jgi:hypothetical protein